MSSAATLFRLPVLLLVDVSGSMSQHGKLAAQSESVAQMIEAFSGDATARGTVRLAVVAFGGASAELALTPSDIDDARWEPPAADGRTPLGAALGLAEDLLSDPGFVSQDAYRPVLVLTSDGHPTDQWDGPFERLLASTYGAQSDRLAIAIGEDADEGMLGRFVSDPAHVLTAHDGPDIVEHFRRITLALTRVLTAGTPGTRIKRYSLDLL